MGNDNLRFYQFGEFKLDSRRRILYKNGDRVDISGKNFELLYFLIENEGRILSHDEILDAVWHGTFVEQSNLKKGISALRQILEERADESLYIKTVPRQGYAFVAPVTAVADEPDSRPDHVHASQTEIYIEEIEEFIEQDNSASPQLAGSVGASKKRLWIAAGLILIAAIGAFALWRFVLQGSPVERLTNVRVDKIGSDGDCYGRVSPDGNFIACVLKDEAGDSAIEIRQIATDGRRRLISLPKSNIYAIDYSKDGNFIYYVQKNFADDSRSGIHKISVLGGEPKMVVANAGSMAVASDGRILLSRSVSGGGAKVLLVDQNGANESVVAEFPGNFRIWDFKFSPGDKAATISIRKQLSDIKNVFYVIEAPFDGSAQRTLVPERDTLIASATWTSDAKSLLLCIREKNADIRQVWQYVLASGEMTRITNDNTSYKDVQVLKDGKTFSAVAENSYTNIYIGEPDKFEFRQITSGVQSIDGAFWLRDGRLGYAAVENSAEVIRIMSEDGRSRERVNEGKDGYWIQPSLSGDGRTIAFNSNRAGLDQLWRIGIDGREPVQLTRSETPIFNGKLLSDGTVIYKTSVPTEGWMLMQITPDGKLTRLNIPDIDVWSISPDEKQIASVHGGTTAKDCEIRVYDRNSFEVVKSVKLSPVCDVDRMIWDRDGLGFTFVATSEGTSELYRVPISGGEPKKISNFRHDRVYTIDWSSDGKKLAIVRGRTYLDPIVLKPAD
ncbi:MAG: winged helix-turn-helix domain-containing protein [Pyrinomonadaceae bacterium]